MYVLKRQHELAIAAAERAITLDPSYAYGYASLAEILNFAGRPEEAVGLLVEKAQRLDPDAAAYYSTFLGHAYFLLRRHEDAIVALKRTLTRNPDYLLARARLAAVYSELDHHTEARTHLAAWRRLSPQGSLAALKRTLPYKEQADLDRYLAALHKAGLR